ncbi:MAG: two-component regulator propeller domain-containing protein [Bacteroidales bacterium]
MINKARLLFICVCSICLFYGAHAHESVSFYSKNTQDGLSDNWVRCVYQDNRGFMWFGTSSGLNRYDGVNFKHVPFNYTNINAIVSKDDEHMLVCTDIGVFLYNIYTHKSSVFPIHYFDPVLCTAIDTNGTYWFGTNNGLIKYNDKTGKSEIFKYSKDDTTTISNNYVNTILIDNENNVWVGTKFGLNKFNRQTQNFSRFYATTNWPELISNDILTLVFDAANRLWIGSARGGLTVCENPYDEPQNFRTTTLFSGNIITLCVDSQHQLWIGRGSGEGLHVLDLKDYEFGERARMEHYLKSPLHANSLSDNSIFHVYEDNLGDIWIGTFGGGINYTSKRIKKFHVIEEYKGSEKILSSNLINCFLEDEDKLWIGTESGLDCWHKNTNTFTSYINEPGNPQSLQGNSVYSLHKDSFGNLWVGTWSGGLNKFNEESQTFTHIPLGTNSTNSVFAIEEDSLHNLWIGTVDPNDGVFRYNLISKDTYSYTEDSTDETTIFSNSINDIKVSDNQCVYISNFHGLDVYNSNTKKFTHYPLPNFSGNPYSIPYISSIYINHQNDILVGTNYGVIQFDTVQKKFKKPAFYSNYNTTVQGIVQDSKDVTWISTLNGIKRFIPSPNHTEAEVQSFTFLDGISANETKARAIYKDSFGYIYIGTSQGFTYFHEDSIDINTIVPPVEITNMLLLKYVPNQNAEYIPITESSFYQDTITLDYESSDFIIKYAALNYLVPQKNRYSYKLVGYDSEWIDAGTQTSVTYTNIQPGIYTFMVKGANNDGIWNKQPCMLTIHITPPWWQTIYFYIGVLICVVLIIWGIIKLRLSMYARQKRMLMQKVDERTRELSHTNTILQDKQEEISRQNEELFRHRNDLQKLIDDRTADLLVAKQKAEESDRLKSAFLSNMSHEIRTPMNGIVGFSEMLVSDELSQEEKNEYARVIAESSKQLLRIVDDILSISRIETGAMSVNTESVDLHELMEEVRGFFELQARAKNISYIQDVPDDEIHFETDKTKLFQIISNLLGNALKFTSKGEIHCGVVCYSSWIQFYVKDTGIGIPPKLHTKIFERFRQAELTVSRTYGGTGLGLAISKKLVELLGGEIWLESEVNVGSSFYFTLPYKKANPTERDNTLKVTEFRSLSSKKILVAEDNAINYYYVEQILGHANIPYIRAKNGEDAIEKCKIHHNEIGMILMDVKMPLKDGITAAQEILNMFPDIPILIQTAFVLTLQKDEATRIGCVGVIAKPIKREELLSYISSYMLL